MRIPFGRSIICCARAAPFGICFVFLLLLSCGEKGQESGGVSVAGHVISALDLTPIESASVRLVHDNIDESVVTSSDGAFLLGTFHGKTVLRNAVLIVEKDGYETLDSVLARVEGGNAMDLTLKLVASK